MFQNSQISLKHQLIRFEERVF